MVPLSLGSEPPELAVYLVGHPHAGPAEFENDGDFQDTKGAIKAKLNDEQSGLCVYCEKVLRPIDGHVEHVHPKRGPHADATRTFVYANLAQSCQGYHKEEKKRHCGDAKGHLVLTLPPSPGCNEPFVLHDDGLIVPNRANPTPGLNPDDLAKQVDETLRLNLSALKAERKGVLDAVKQLPQQERLGFLLGGPFRFIVQQFPDFSATLQTEVP